MKVAIIGTRGIPAQYGGFETFAQELGIRLVKMGFDITVFCPSNKDKIQIYQGVKLEYTKTDKDKTPMAYYCESVKKAVKNRFDIILMCGQGGYAYIPYLFNSKKNRPIFITNTDGIEHRRTKWNKIVRFGVRIVGEFTSVLFSDYLIADSKGIKDYLQKEYKIIPKKKISTIEYGAETIDDNYFKSNLLTEYNLNPYQYHLVVSRLEPENNVKMIIEGFTKANSQYPLVVIGNLKDTEYVKSLQSNVENHNIVFLGGIYDSNKLKALRLYSISYLHGHSVGGTNPSLLEALGAGNIVIGHDNTFNREVTDNKMFYFKDSNECAKAITTVENMTSKEKENYKDIAKHRITNYYNWERIANEYANLFNSINK